VARALVTDLPIPQSVDEASELMRQLQLLEQKLERIPLGRDKQIADLKDQAKQEMDGVKKEMAPIMKALIAFAQARRNELTGDDTKKTVVIEPGKLRWRFTPKKITFVKGKLGEVIAAVKANLKRFWKFKSEPEIKLNKKAMLDDPQRALELPYVSIQQSEVLVIELDDVAKKVIHKIRVLSTDEIERGVPDDLIEIDEEEEGDAENSDR
jgi:phage host-nuclease inhibitor protein Gam